MFKYDLKRPDLIGPGLATITACAMLSIPLWTIVMRRTSKRLVCLIGAVIGVVGYLGFAVANGAIAPIFSALAVLGFGAGASYLTFWAMVPDTVEYGEWKSGVRAEGIIFGVISFIQKAALGVSVGVLGELLGAVGYVANQPQTGETLTAMRTIMTLSPAVLALAGAAIISRYPLSNERHGALVALLQQREAESDTPLSQSSK
jgi:GPH family glycoside/pentoside/hexuronide:cation symporter